MDFKPTGAKIFSDLTGNNVGKRMAIVLDGNVYSAPSINERIPGGSAQITLGRGDYEANMREARDLALVLRAGALPVELIFEEQRVVGPSLGADAIERAELAGIIGSFVVFAFMILYYKVSGVIADLSERDLHSCDSHRDRCHPFSSRDRGDCPYGGYGRRWEHHHLRKDTGGTQARPYSDGSC